MKVLVTGGAGFIGSNLVDLLIKNSHETIIIDNLSNGREKNVNKKAKFYKIDIRDQEKLKEVFNKEKPEIVFHLAAHADVTTSVKNPVMDAQINILGSLNILELCKEYKIKKIIYSNSGGAGSGEPQYIPIDEKHPIKPQSPYGISKHTVEHYLEIYKEIHGLNYTSLRYANVYGPRQDPYGEGGVVAIFSNKLINNESPKIFGDGNQTRDFIFVDDVAEINLFCIDKGHNKVFNIGTGKEVTVNELFLKIKNLLNSKLNPIYAEKRPGEIYRSVFNIDKIKKELKWQPKISLDTGLKKTIEYFKNP